jgi:hypothetical protein
MASHFNFTISVFLYDSNFDLKLKSTREAEEEAARKASR